VREHFWQLRRTDCAERAVTYQWAMSECSMPAANRPVVPSTSLPSDWLPKPNRTPGRTKCQAVRSWSTTSSLAESCNSENLLMHHWKPISMCSNDKIHMQISKRNVICPAIVHWWHVHIANVCYCCTPYVRVIDLTVWLLLLVLYSVNTYFKTGQNHSLTIITTIIIIADLHHGLHVALMV